MVMTAYTPTTTAPVINSIPVLMTAPTNTPRLNYNPNTGKPLGLLVEMGRTNLLTYSQLFSNVAWSITNTSLTSAANIAPDSTITVFNLVDTATTGLHAISQTVTKAASAIAYTASVYFKANQRTYSWLQISDGVGNGAIVYFNLSTGVISTAVAGVGTAFTGLAANITLVGNGWYICTITGTSNTATSIVTQFGSSVDGNSNSFTGNNYSGIYIWGAQLEAGAFATSYIPTVSSTVTRNADAASITGTNFSSWYNNSQGTFYVDFQGAGGGPTAVGYGRIIGYGSSSAFLSFANATYVINTFNDTTGGAYQIVLPSADYWKAGGKAAMSYNLTSRTITIIGNGVLQATVSNNAATPRNNVASISIGSNIGGSNMTSMHIRTLSYYRKELSSSNLQALTS